MKKEELLDLITEFKPDDAFVEEALGEREGAPIRVYAGKRSPMRIIAPIAACLAVFVAAGFLVVNVSRGKLAIGPAASTEESSEVDEISEPVLSGEEEFVEKCKEIVTAEYELASQDNAVFSTEYFDIDFDGEDELLIYPKLIKGFGVRVFKGTDADNIQDLGSFGTETNTVRSFFEFSREVTNKHYYCNVNKTSESYTADIREIYLDEDTNQIKDVSYLKYAATRSDAGVSSTPILVEAYRYGEEIAIEDLFLAMGFMPFDPMISVSDWDVMSDYDKAFAEKYDVPLSDISSLAHSYMVVDPDGDGRDEVIIRFEDSEQFGEYYVFGVTDGGEIECMGELPHEGELGYGNPALINDMRVHQLDEDGESYCYFVTVDHREDGSFEGAVNKIIVNDDGTFGFDKIVVHSTEKLDDGTQKSYYRVNGKEVSAEEFSVIRDKYGKK